MEVSLHRNIKRITIHPGEYYASDEELIISTLLGSCVSACLWDPVNSIVGMNHFLLANKHYSRESPVIASEVGRYGIHSMEIVINSMLHLGAQKSQLRAKAFGGGNVILGMRPTDNFFAVGDINSRFVKEYLLSEDIPLEVCHLGGNFGRIIHFHSKDFSVYMKRIEHQEEREVIKEERQYWKQEIKEHEKAESDLTGQIQYW